LETGWETLSRVTTLADYHIDYVQQKLHARSMPPLEFEHIALISKLFSTLDVEISNAMSHVKG
jgi:hypothetical protein